jgi:EEF1A lysine methyltransferase 4
MEPENVADYSKVQYWDQRYSKEPSYDWFNSVYGECLTKMVNDMWDHFNNNNNNKNHNKKQIRVLHLGTGNSRLVHDLATAWYEKAKAAAITTTTTTKETESNDKEDEEEEQKQKQQQICELYQVAIDYSSVVIENMKKGEQPAVGPKVEWIVADMRDLSQIVPVQQHDGKEGDDESKASTYNFLFDVVIDKGTMDALQADKDSDTLDEDIDAMLKETSRVLTKDNGLFYQVSWEVPYFRKHWVMREEYGWKNDDMKVTPLNQDKDTGDALYRMFKYVKKQ